MAFLQLLFHTTPKCRYEYKDKHILEYKNGFEKIWGFKIKHFMNENLRW